MKTIGGLAAILCAVAIAWAIWQSKREGIELEQVESKVKQTRKTRKSR